MNRSIVMSCAVILCVCGWLIWRENGETAGETVAYAVEAEQGDSEKIRVLLLSDGYASPYHGEVCIGSTSGCTLQLEAAVDSADEEETDTGNETVETEETNASENGAQVWELQGGEEIRLTWSDGGLQIGDQTYRLPEEALESKIVSEGESSAQKLLTVTAGEGQILLPDLEREYDSPAYYGTLELYAADQGFLLVNELLLETYLCGVVPSEMPASYPEEALKAQAICARTYALSQIEEQRMKDFPAQLDDSTSYQVYNNQPSTDATDQAVRDTEGLVLMQDGELADARYYSTSCGLDLHLDLSDETVFAAFLSEDQLSSWESEEPLYRWQVQILLSDLGITEMEVTERGENGAAEILTVTEKGRTRTIQGEYKIRKFLAKGAPVVTLQDGSSWETPGLLPSAFFILTPVLEEEKVVAYDVRGGGYGHGIGMSQNGAKQMAKSGKTCEEILTSYYENVEICSVS